MVAIKLAVGNLEKSVKFYKEALGYRDERLGGKIDFADTVMIGTGERQVWLEEMKAFEKAFPEFKDNLAGSQLGLGVTISLHVEDTDWTYGRVEPLGGKITKQITSTASGDRGFICRDPDGYLLGLHSHPGEHGHPHQHENSHTH